jgi:hypothetical protein
LLYNRPGAYRVLADTTLTFDPGIPLVQDVLALSFAPVVTLSGGPSTRSASRFSSLCSGLSYCLSHSMF